MNPYDRYDLQQLTIELNAAGIPVDHLSVYYNPETDTYTFLGYDAAGASFPLPPEADPVIAAHVPPPKVIDFAGVRPVDKIVRTLDATPLEIFRIQTKTQHVYRATFRMTGIDAQNGTTRDSEARMVFKRLAATLAQVGATAILANFQDAAASSWAILPTVDGTDLVISVRGAAGRTIDWLLVGEIGSYSPGGI